MSPRVSVCVVTYNHRAYIEHCLMSVLSQSIDVELEVLVGDDASTDGTAEVVQKVMLRHPTVITLFRHKANLGAAANYQFLVQRARGDYIAHFDGDDFWLPGKLARQLDCFVRYPDCSAVYANAAVVSAEGVLLGVFNNRQPDVFDKTYLLERGNFLFHSTLLYPRNLKSCVLSIEGTFIDYQIHLRLASHGRLAYVNEALAAYRIGHAGTMTGSTPRLVFDLYWQAIREGLRDLGGAPIVKLALRQFWARTLVRNVVSRSAPSCIEAVAMIRLDFEAFGAKDVSVGVLYALAICWNLIRSRLGDWVSGIRLRVLHRR